MGLDENGAHLLQCVTRLLRIPASQSVTSTELPESSLIDTLRFHSCTAQCLSLLTPSSSSVCTWHR